MAIPSSGTIQEIAFKLAETRLLEQQQRDDLHSETTIFVLGSPNVVNIIALRNNLSIYKSLNILFQGKTTIINKFLDKEPTQSTRPTLALEYSFARRTTSNLGNHTGGPHQQTNRPVCHVWELGGSDGDRSPAQTAVDENPQNNLCDIPLRSAALGLRQMRIVIVLDLSQPDRIWSDLTQALQRLDVAFRKAPAATATEMGGGGVDEYETIRAQRWQLQQQLLLSQSDDLEDEGGGGGTSWNELPMPPQYFPVPLLLVGGKYDVFKNFGEYEKPQLTTVHNQMSFSLSYATATDPEIKKHICRALRSVALLLGATALLFVSTHSPPQMAAVRANLNQFAFRSRSDHQPKRRTNQLRHQSSAGAAVVVDHNEALSIVAGADSWTLIGHMPKQAVAEVGVMLAAHIPQRTAKAATVAAAVASEPDPAHDPDFREPAVDEMRAQLDAELLERWRDQDVRQNFHSMSSMAESSGGF